MPRFWFQRRAEKQLTSPAPSFVYLPRTWYDYRSDIKDARLSTLVAAIVEWVAKAVTEAPVVVLKWERSSRTWSLVEGHPLAQLIDRPNESYSGAAMVQAVVRDLYIHGNAYLLKERSTPSGRVVGLWYLPAEVVQAIVDEDGSVRYRTRDRELRSEDLVHFRYRLSHRDGVLGESPLEPLWRELSVDEEASNYVAALLRNLGVPGVVISPADSSIELTKEDAEALVQRWTQKLTGDLRGEPIFLSGNVKVERLSFSPEEFELREVRRVPEERVAAVLGVPAVVVGFGAGLERSTFANYGEAREAAYEQTVIPIQRLIANELELQLLPEFERNVMEYNVSFDLSNVRILQEDLSAAAQRAIALLQAGVISVEEAREMLGLETVSANEEKTFAVKSLRKAQRFLLSVRRKQEQHIEEYTAKIERVLRGMGNELADAYRAEVKSLRRKSLEAQLEMLYDSVFAAIVADAIDRMTETYEELYGASLSSVTSTLTATYGLAVNLPDEVARQVVREGGRRVGLLDLPSSTKRRLFEVILQGREEGLNPLDIAPRIARLVPSGRFGSPAARARTIARTETLHAYRVSALTAYKSAKEVTAVVLFDNQTDYNDLVCMARDGKVVPFEEAEREIAAEHPNGTLNFAPWVP
jgi:HK97 family phage portal protein